MLIVKYDEVRKILDGQEHRIMDAIRQAYILHADARTSIPHSVFLRFPDEERNRIIGLPAYLGGENAVTGMKWVASFPGNTERRLPRASAVVVTNSVRTGRPESLIEGSLISARRTGASAALAAGALAGDRPDRSVSLIGCGVINFEVLRFLRAALPELVNVLLFDSDADRCAEFADRCAATWPELTVTTAGAATEALREHRLVSIATTAIRPHLEISECRPGTLILHVSLRDLTGEAILDAHNVVDDADHVCREQTSVHLAEQLTGHREFIHDEIGDLLKAGDGAGRAPDRVTVFSPFGLGVLDLAVAELVRSDAASSGIGVEIPDFLP
jgi:2,3-diaminopropionate biosynthesis protein SbnB